MPDEKRGYGAARFWKYSITEAALQRHGRCRRLKCAHYVETSWLESDKGAV